MAQQLTVDQFAEKIKAKYPDYKNVDNKLLTEKILTKYPEYQGKVSLRKTAAETLQSDPRFSLKAPARRKTAAEILQNPRFSLPATVTPSGPSESLFSSLNLKEDIAQVYGPMEAAKNAISGLEDKELNYSPDKEPIRYNIAASFSAGRKKALEVISEIGLDPLNALPLGTLLSKGRPALRIGADLLFAGIAEVGAVQALKDGRYDDAAIQQAFALIGMAGATHVVSEGRKRLIFEEARTRKAPRSDQQIKTDAGFYKKLAEQTKEVEAAVDPEVQQFETLKARAETPVEQAAPEAGSQEWLEKRFTPEELAELAAAEKAGEKPASEAVAPRAPAEPILETEPPVSGETPIEPIETPAVVTVSPISGEKKPESTTATLYADLGKIREHSAKGNAAPTPEQSSEYIRQIRRAAETHLPEALPAVEAAEAAVQSGDIPAFVKAAEDARGLLRKSYGERLAADEAAKHGYTLPKDEPALTEAEHFKELQERAGDVAPEDMTPDADLSPNFGSSMMDSLNSMETAARERMAARGDKGRMGSEKGASPILDDINDLITIGVAKIGKGTIRFTQWSAEMIAEFGDRVRPHLQDIYSKSMERVRELKNFDADEYFNFKRVNMSAAEKQRLIDLVTEETLATGRVPKEKITFDQVRRDAAEIAGEDILKYVDSAQKGATEYRAARFAMRQRINGLSTEVVGLRQRVAETGTLDPGGAMNLERELLVKESDLSALLDSHMRLRSEEGRNLAINRMEADSTWDVSYWMNRARQAEGLPPNVPVSESVGRKIQEVHAEGVAAQTEFDAAVADSAAQAEVAAAKARAAQAAQAEAAAKAEAAEAAEATAKAAQQAAQAQTAAARAAAAKATAQAQTATKAAQTAQTQAAAQTAAAKAAWTQAKTFTAKAAAQTARIKRAQRRMQVARQSMASTVTQLQKSGWLETLSSLRKAGLFGVFTRVRNIGANVAFHVAEEVSRLPAVLVDMAVNLGGGDRQVQGISPRAIAKSAAYAATQGLRDAGDAIKYGLTTNELGRVEIQKPLNTGIRWLDNFANFQFREMAAEDRIFKSYSFRRSLEEQLWLESRRTGQPMPSATQIQSSIAAAKMRGQGSGVPAPLAPTEAMISNAIAYAEYATFNNRNMLASALRSGQGTLRTKGPAGKAASFGVDMVIPFANTPANVIARQFDYTAIGALPRMVTSAVRGLKGPERRTFELAFGRGLTGSALIYLGWKLAENGLATGTWEEEAGQRNVAEAAGRTPGAVRVGGRWIGTGQLAPAGSLIMIGAALQREATQPVANEMGRFGKVAAIGTKAAMEQPFLSGMSNLVEALQNPGNRGERFASSMVGSFVPTYVSEISAGFDPYMRDARPEGFSEMLTKGAQSRTPGRSALPTRLDVLGQDRGNFTVGSPALEVSDSIRNELQSNSISVGFPQRKPDETATTYRLRSQLVGRLIDDHVGRAVKRPGYPVAPIDRRREWLDKAVAEAREQASQILDRKFRDEEAHEKFLLAQIDRVESRLKARPAVPMIPSAPKPAVR